jgi:hypothetical protein
VSQRRIEEPICHVKTQSEKLEMETSTNNLSQSTMSNLEEIESEIETSNL